MTDRFAACRAQFYLPPGLVYLDGNSLGLLCRPAEEELAAALEQWRSQAITGWTAAHSPWLGLAGEVAALTAPLLGADPRHVTASASTTVNLHQLLGTLYHPRGKRRAILLDTSTFPSDAHAVSGHLRMRGEDPDIALRWISPRTEGWLDEGDLLAAMDDQVALAVLPGVVYTTGQLLDMARLAEGARRRDVVLLLDLSHSVGAVPHHLDEWGVDAAFWCGYKYLNGGPGAAAGLYLSPRHGDAYPGMPGWFGSDPAAQFRMQAQFQPAVGAARLQIGTPHILSLAPLRGSLRLLAEVGMESIRRRSLELTARLLQAVEELPAGFGVTSATPPQPQRRGGHVSLRHPEAARLCRALRRRGIVPDHRPPDLIRLAPVALYNDEGDCDAATAALISILESGEHLHLAGADGAEP